MIRFLAPLALIAVINGTVTAQIPSGTLKSATLWFDAKASLGPFRGTTKVARGMLDGAPTLAKVHGFVEADAATLSTDNSLRDHDMRKTLDVEKFTTIRFDLDSVAVHREVADSTEIELAGRMTIHGVTRQLRIPAYLRRQRDELRVTGSCSLFLPDFGVTKLKRMFGTLSMNETIQIGLDVTFATTHPGVEE